MDNILERMLKNRKTEELARLDAINIVNNLFNQLLDREKDVLSRRFGLKGDKSETLEKIGKMHKLTRERVRQIEAASIRKIKKIESLEDFVGHLKKTINALLQEHGGLLSKEYLLNILATYCLDGSEFKNENEHGSAYRNSFDFIISKFLDEDFEMVKNSDKFNTYYKIKNYELSHLEEITEEILSKIDEKNETVKTEDLLFLTKNLSAYEKHKGNLESLNQSDLKSIFKNNKFFDQNELINDNKILYSLLNAIKHIDQNKYGHWGKSDWHEIKPKTINDKIYLVLKNEAKPLHFTEIANKINEVKFDHKKANPATVHNELILDNRYVLTGRGMYALKEYQQ